MIRFSKRKGRRRNEQRRSHTEVNRPNYLERHEFPQSDSLVPIILSFQCLLRFSHFTIIYLHTGSRVKRAQASERGEPKETRPLAVPQLRRRSGRYQPEALPPGDALKGIPVTCQRSAGLGIEFQKKFNPIWLN